MIFFYTLPTKFKKIRYFNLNSYFIFHIDKICFTFNIQLKLSSAFIVFEKNTLTTNTAPYGNDITF